MKVKMLKTAAGPEFVHTANSIVDIDDDTAQELIKAEAAEPASTSEDASSPAAAGRHVAARSRKR